MRQRARHLVALVLALAMLASAGCSDGNGGEAGGGTGSESPPPPAAVSSGDDAAVPQPPRVGGALVFGVGSLRTDWRPWSGPYDADAYQVARAMYDPLLVYDDSNNLTPYAAAEVVPNEDLTVWSIRLRDEVRFWDGTPLGAEPVAAGLEAARSSPTFGPLLRPIRTITVRGERLVEVAMRTPWSAFPHLLAGQLGFVVRPSDGIAVGTGPFAPATASATSPTTSSTTTATANPTTTAPALPSTPPTDGGGNPVTPAPTSATPETTTATTAPTGPDGATTAAAVTPAGSLSLVRNERWWQPDLPRLDAVEFRAVPDESARAALLRDGAIDVGLFSDPARLAVFAEESRRGTVQHLIDTSGETPELVLALQTDRAPFEDPVARQAMGQAIDRDALAADVFAGQYPAAEGPYSEGARWYGRAPWPLHDVPRARETVDVYTKDHGEALRLRLLAAPSPLARDLVDALARQLAEAGIQVEPEWAEPDQVSRRVVAGQFEAALISGFGGWHPDQDEAVLRGFVTGSVPPAGAPEDAPPALPLPPPDPATPPWAANLTRFRSEVIDRALDTARTSTDITKQAEQYTSIQEALAKEAPYIFLVHQERAVVARPGVADLERWVTPAGTPGISQFRGTVALQQVWLRP